MKSLLVAFLFAGMTTFKLSAQMTPVETSDIQQIVQEYLLGNGVFASNVTFNGQIADFSYHAVSAFEDPTAEFGLPSGLILATGTLSGIFGTPYTYEEPYVFQDPDILALPELGTSVGELASLEFDFIATGDSMAFRYVFASGEYNGWEGSQYNDHFGFFISGPGIEGPFSNNAVNLALLPESVTPVGINTVNANMNSGYYVSMEAGDPYPFHGHTVVLHACIGDLQVGETYHIKLAIADISDEALDSYIFLDGASFQQYCGIEEETPQGVQMQQNCLLCSLEADVEYTLYCGQVQLTNHSDILLENVSCYYNMGDGNLIPACEETTSYTYGAPGIYPLKLIYEVNGFTSVHFIENMEVEEFSTPEVVYSDGVFTLMNHDGVSEIQWLLDGSPLDDAEGVSYIPVVPGIYTVQVENGCIVTSEPVTVSGMNEQMQTGFRIFPNPSSGYVQMELPVRAERVVVFDMNGKRVREHRTQGKTNLDWLMEPGMYAFHILDRKGNIIGKHIQIME